MPRRALCLSLLTGLSMLVPAVGCGARTDLWGLPPCSVEGEEIECLGVCGEGHKRCVDGFWTACETAVVTETCEDACGRGTRTCEAEVWTACQVDPVVEACTNACGEGTRVCVDETWSDCEVEPTERACSTKCGDGIEICEDGTWGACSAPKPLPPRLEATVRDFRDSHPDFELGLAISGEKGIVEDVLGPDDKPVYAGGSDGTLTTSGPETFNQWYRDVEGINLTTTIELPLAQSPTDDRLYIYEGDGFFPIDGALFGNQGRSHNYHFTLEASGSFLYRGGETFRFTGDDDVWVFVNRRLVIDLGGLHEELTEIVEIDDVAGTLGLSVGEEYPLHIFFAERQTVESNFNVETSIAGLGECP